MSDHEWSHEFARCLGMLLNGGALTETGSRGERVTDGNFLVLFNAHHEEIRFRLPDHAQGLRWQAVLDTTIGDGLTRGDVFDGGGEYRLNGRSLALLQEQGAKP
jgi:glycogen operon protein